MQAIISGQVPANEQGEIQGTLSSLMSASAIVGPPVMSSTFYFFTHKEAPVLLPGAPFILASIIMLASTIIAYTTLRKHRQNLLNKAEETQQSNQ